MSLDLTPTFFDQQDVAAWSGPSGRLLQIAEIALSCARMCAWDWDMLAGETIYFGDPRPIFGCVPSADYEHGFRAMVHPEDIAGLEPKIQQSSSQRFYEDEFRVVHPDGSVRWIYARGRFFHDETGGPVRLIGVNVDVTEQKSRDMELEKVRLAVQAQHAMLDTIVNNIPVMICYMREPGKVQWANRAWHETLGWSPQDNHGDTAALLYPDPEELDKVREFIARADGKPGEFKTRTKSGEILDTNWLNATLPDGTNIGIGRDVTAEKKAGRDLRESERRFEALSDNIPQIAWITNPDGETLYLNRRWYEYTGQSPEVALGYGWRDIMHPEDLETNAPLWEKANREGTDYENEIRMRGHDGEYRWFLVRAIPIRREDGAIEYWFGTNTDITEKKQSQEALIRAEKLAFAGRFAATVAHEVNNPLTAVTNIHYMLLCEKTFRKTSAASLRSPTQSCGGCLTSSGRR
ncbi:PAS domain S-box protein [Acidobacteria bacterium AB60]|nr:PAS domain S-box protein [Acidobacteria bacterium AB60]